MNRTYTYIYILITAAILVTSNSCTKDIVDEFTPIEERWASLNDFISSTTEDKIVSIQAAESEFVIETDHAIMHFPAESIRDEITGAVITGPVDIVYQELTSYKDFFLNDIDTETIGGETIYSQYALNFRLKQGTKSPVLNDLFPAFIYLNKDDNTIDEEKVFFWNTNDNEDGWFLNSNTDVFSEEWDFEVDGKNFAGKGYKMLLRGTNMFCLGEHEHLLYENSEEYGTLDISINENFKNSNTKLFFARKENLSLIPLKLFDGKYSHIQVRKGEEVTIFGMTVVDEKIYFGRKNIIAGAVNAYDLSFKEVTYVEAIEELQRM